MGVAHQGLLTAGTDGVHIICSCGWDEPIGNFLNPVEAMSIWMKHVLQTAFNQVVARVKMIQETLPKEGT